MTLRLPRAFRLLWAVATRVARVKLTRIVVMIEIANRPGLRADPLATTKPARLAYLTLAMRFASRRISSAIHIRNRAC